MNCDDVLVVASIAYIVIRYVAAGALDRIMWLLATLHGTGESTGVCRVECVMCRYSAT